MTTAFVTGATGFIGRHLCAALRARQVTVQEHRSEAGDVRDAAAIRHAIERANPDCVFHLAADVRRSAPLREMLETNVAGTMNVLDAAQGRPLIAVGSFEEYGDCPAPFREDMVPRPATPYGISKAMASLLVSASSGVVIRLPVVYGPGQSAKSFLGAACHALRSRTRFAMTFGKQTRDFLYVADAVSALVMVAHEFEACCGEILNACTGVPVTLLEATQLIGGDNFADIGAIPYRPNEQMHYFGDCTKIDRLTGWKAAIPFDEGIRRTLSGNVEN